METTHKNFYQNSQDMSDIPSNSIDLMVTSPPYPMIEMWDDIFSNQNAKILDALKKRDGNKAFELMHQILDPVWDETFRVLKNGGFACINIGDATRTINGNFSLYPNHARILQYLRKIGFTSLPDILWRKQTNAPNKFMGSGMLPAGAYVTLEHEYILIVRKGSKREFIKDTEKIKRRESSFFWEERNIFFSDIWLDIKGTTQGLVKSSSRKRSGAFPFDLAYRLINMYSVKGDIVLDPFLGTGTVMAASMTGARNSIGFEIDNMLKKTVNTIKDDIIDFSNQIIQNRLNNHIDFVKKRIQLNKVIKHRNEHYGFPVITNQEKLLMFNDLISVKQIKNKSFIIDYYEKPQDQFCLNWEKLLDSNFINDFKFPEIKPKSGQQLELF
ncbi:MAG: site-specific DNA-methyltransferase [Desulfobacterales bacterium]|nr:site-specific DNA-methyltransferase [Desulfobacterales bacterium]